MPADRVFAYDHPHPPSTCYHDFAPSSASAPFLTLVRLHGTDYQKTFERNLTSLTFQNFLKLTILILCLTYNNSNILLVMHPWPSCSGRIRNAVSIWVCTGPHYFYCPSPDFTTSIVSQSVTNNRCAPSCGGHKRKVRGYIKKFSSRRNCAPPPHLQIASDATVCISLFASCSRLRVVTTILTSHAP